MRSFIGYICQGVDENWNLKNIPIGFRVVLKRHTGNLSSFAKIIILAKCSSLSYFRPDNQRGLRLALQVLRPWYSCLQDHHRSRVVYEKSFQRSQRVQIPRARPLPWPAVWSLLVHTLNDAEDVLEDTRPESASISKKKVIKWIWFRPRRRRRRRGWKCGTRERWTKQASRWVQVKDNV